jgi:hypothetical protein
MDLIDNPKQLAEDIANDAISQTQALLEGKSEILLASSEAEQVVNSLQVAAVCIEDLVSKADPDYPVIHYYAEEVKLTFETLNSARQTQLELTRRLK